MNTDIDGNIVQFKHFINKKRSFKPLSFSIRCRKSPEPSQLGNKITSTQTL